MKLPLPRHGGSIMCPLDAAVGPQDRTRVLFRHSKSTCVAAASTPLQACRPTHRHLPEPSTLDTGRVARACLGGALVAGDSEGGGGRRGGGRSRPEVGPGALAPSGRACRRGRRRDSARVPRRPSRSRQSVRPRMALAARSRSGSIRIAVMPGGPTSSLRRTWIPIPAPG